VINAPELFSAIASYTAIETGETEMPIILWLLGVPLGLVVVLWLLHVV
jgi:hypothetical protein